MKTEQSLTLLLAAWLSGSSGAFVNTRSSFATPSTRPVLSSRTTIQSSTELALSPVEAWSAYNDALEASPLLVKSVTASAILGAADLAGQALEAKQKSEEGTNDVEASIDWARTVRFAFFGLVLQAPWNHFYYNLLDGALPPTEEPWTAVTGIKVTIDQFVQAPIFTVLIFGFLGALEGKNLEAIKKQLDEDYTDTMLANWKLWVPATVVNIAFVPPILRVLYLNCVFFFWSIFLSIKLNKGDGEDLTA
ncbi:PXMP2/4 family protein [Seminavis robusta]|uniref:PXMP2/4 family protein n=1 Tax=Seminavis robusta TaxID=568900 RepID=A0A9N8DAX6_9STRA|nr:PXMP2/4 family protein [Seminavis robusta]|eukprot:Sro70_g038760.1 PXMP2/4 family protein (249) ;mRNA; r:12844-13590